MIEYKRHLCLTEILKNSKHQKSNLK